MIPPRLPLVTPRSSTASTVDAEPSSQAGAISGSASASGHKHSLPPPPAPPAIRPRLHVDASQAAPHPLHQDRLQRQAQINQQAIATALESFGMDWNALNEQQRQDLFRATTVLPPHPPGTTEASRREEQLHAVLFSIQKIEGMASEVPGTGDEAATHKDGGIQASQSLASAAQKGKQPADRLPYSTMHATRHWSSGNRAKEFEPLKQALEKKIGKPVSGGAFLQLLSQACDKAKPEERKLITELNEKKVKGKIFEFNVQIDPGADVVQVWRGAYDNDYIDLRRAPKKNDNKAYTDLLREMRTSAQISTGQRSNQHTPYSASDAWGHWNDNEQRAKEFEPLRQAWQEATEKSARQANGSAFLRHLSAECDKAKEGGKLIEDLGKHGGILEFEVQTHEGAMAQRVWRGVDDKGHVNLRLAPEEGNREAREKLLDEMKQSMQKANSSLRTEQLPGGVIYSYRDAKNHWNRHKQRAEEFEPRRQALEEAMGQRIGGPVFLQLLSQACDKAKQEDCKLIAELNEEKVKGKIFEFKVQMHDGMDAVHVWRRVSDSGHIDLRLAPGNSETRDKLLKEMLHSAKQSSSYRSKRPMLGRFHFILNANRHWAGPRATELEPLRQAWQEATGKSDKQASGPAFLKHLLAECDKAAEKAELLYDLSDNAKIYEFEVQTHPEGGKERFWCWIDGADCITNLRKAPEKGDTEACEKVKAEMIRVVKSNVTRRQRDDGHIDMGAVVKPEPAWLAAAFPAPVAGVEAIRLNTVQMHHVPTITYTMIDLTAGDGSAMTVFTVRHPDEAIVSTGKQTYDPALDKVFPIRAPAHPEQVHPDYADPDDPSRCAAQVALKGIHFYKGGASFNEQTLWQRARNNFKNDFPYKSKKLFIEALKRSCEEDLKATMQARQPPSSRQVRIDLITHAGQCDSPEEFAALHNQYGGFLTDYAPSSQPSLRNARIVCLFAGSRLVSEEDSRQYLDQLGAEFGWQALQDYAANAQQYGKQDQLAWAPYGGGNMGQYFNSSFKPGNEGKLQVDADKTNAFLCPVIVELTDRHGKARKESMLMVIQDRLIDKDKQLKLNYGNDYMLDAKKSELPMPSHPVKQEIPEGQADAGSSMSALDK